MKLSLKGIFLATALGFGAQASAAIITETYSAPPVQTVGEGESYNFVFDFLQPNSPLDDFYTNSNLKLTQDAALGSPVTFQSVTLSLALSSIDFAREATKVGVYALDYFGLSNTYSKVYEFDWNGTIFNPTLSKTFALPTGFVNAFNDSLYAEIVIRATNERGVYNDFSINSVSLSGSTAAVPEPATLALLGLGLLGVAGLARRRSRG